MKKISINTPYIKLGQLLKLQGIITNGADAKVFLEENDVLVNSAEEKRRGKKLYPGDKVIINGIGYEVVAV